MLQSLDNDQITLIILAVMIVIPQSFQGSGHEARARIIQLLLMSRKKYLGLSYSDYWWTHFNNFQLFQITMATTSLRRSLLGVFLQKTSANCLNRCFSCHTKQSLAFAATHNKEHSRRLGSHRGLHNERTECIQEKDAPRELKFTKLTGRGLLRISGPDATELLQGLQTNDTGLLWGGNGVMYTMFLNTQVC